MKLGKEVLPIGKTGENSPENTNIWLRQRLDVMPCAPTRRGSGNPKVTGNLSHDLYSGAVSNGLTMRKLLIMLWTTISDQFKCNLSVTNYYFSRKVGFAVASYFRSAYPERTPSPRTPRIWCRTYFLISFF
jgi:hypothetical protein